MNMEETAQRNLVERLKDNPCRGIVIGANRRGDVIQLTWIMGRSANSQNRVYALCENDMRTEAADPSKVKDPSLIIYTAMTHAYGNQGSKAYIIGNGDQTETAKKDFELAGVYQGTFWEALKTRHCEPDDPTFTPRITAYHSEDMPTSFFSVLRADPRARERWLEAIAEHKIDKKDFPDAQSFYDRMEALCGLNARAFPTIRSMFGIPLQEGFGHCVTTYRPGSKTLDSFEGEPFLVPVEGALEEVMQGFWNSLEPEWRVALAGRQINDDHSYRFAEPINRFNKVEAAKNE